MMWITVGTITVLSRLLKNRYVFKSHLVFVEPEFLSVKLGTSFADRKMLVQRNGCNIKILQQMEAGMELIVFVGFFFSFSVFCCCCLF